MVWGQPAGPLGLRVFMQDGNQSLLNAVSGPALACWVVLGWPLVSSCFSHISVPPLRQFPPVNHSATQVVTKPDTAPG